MANKTVLIVDDNAVNRRILGKILSQDYGILEAGDGCEALAVLRAHVDGVAAVMLDLMMPVMDGFAFLEAVAKETDLKSIPIVVSTGNGDEANEERALREGAWDFISKPYKPQIIRFRLKNAIMRSQLAAFEQLKYLAEYDTLTGVYNKLYFMKKTQQMLKAEPNRTFAFVRFDIDRFQLVNSFYGRREGDNLLIYIARRLQAMEPNYPHYTYGRMEADVFAFCIACREKDYIIGLVHELAEYVKQYKRSFDIVQTYGIYEITDNTMPVDLMLDYATLAAKTVKGDYINCYAFYTPKLSERLVAEQRITNDMSAALAEEQFVIFFQPKYDLGTNTPAGAEALVRWKRTDGTMVPPGDFVPVFERNGFISKLDYYVWDKTCAYLRAWMDRGLQPSPVSVNISRVDIYNPELVNEIDALTKKYGIPSELLQLELTESAYTDNPQAMKEMMRRFHERGFVLLMDDFGSGYSSLNILKEIPVDVLKIDMRFLSGAEIPGRSETIIAAVVRMAKWLRMPTIAEGVEKAEQAEFLREIGCEYAQGYYYARPMPAEDYEALIAKNAVYVPPSESSVDSSLLWLSDSRLDALFSSVLQAVAVYEYKGGQVEMVRANSAFHDMFGFGDSDGDVLRSISPEHRETLLNAFAQVVESGGDAAECDYLRESGAGKPIWVHTKLKYISKVGDKYIIMGSLSDITAQKELDLELSRYHDALRQDENRPCTVLIVDDVELNRVILKEILKKDYRILEAENGSAALEVLEKNPGGVDIILLDLVMPVMDGGEFLRIKKTREAIHNIPVIIITADDTPEQQENTLRLGGSDYIVKPFVHEIVTRRVHNVLESCRHFRRQVKSVWVEQARELPRDAVTGLYTRASAERCAHDVLKAQPQGGCVLVLLDIEAFHCINERFGHTVGDEVLRYTAQQLKASFRQQDITARENRDRFLVLIEKAPPESVRKKCEKLCENLFRTYSLPEKYTLCCDIGMAVSREGEDFLQLYAEANRALMYAKEKGGGCVLSN